MWREVKSLEEEREKKISWKGKQRNSEDELITAADRLHVYVCHVTPRG